MEPVTPKLFDAPFVSHDAGVLAGAVMLRPSTRVDRLVPIQGEPSPIGERAIEQHAILVRTLRDRGVAVTVLEPVLESPGESLVGDLAIVLPQGAILTRPAPVERRAETAALESALGQLGIPVVGRITAPGLLDAGDIRSLGVLNQGIFGRQLFATDGFFLGEEIIVDQDAVLLELDE